VTRQAKSDVVIHGYSVKKGEVIMAPSFLGHRDQTQWDASFSGNEDRDMPPEGVWFGERFLRFDEAGDVSLNTKDTAGKYFPFGGGANMCPGRIFARQEVLGVVAAFLVNFEIGFVGFVDKKGKPKGGKEGFPIVARQFAGTGVVTAEGDVRLRIRRRAS
jgi:cytochrome P450